MIDLVKRFGYTLLKKYNVEDRNFHDFRIFAQFC